MTTTETKPLAAYFDFPFGAAELRRLEDLLIEVDDAIRGPITRWNRGLLVDRMLQHIDREPSMMWIVPRSDGDYHIGLNARGQGEVARIRAERANA